MVSRNIRNKANRYIYIRKREFELETVKKYIGKINSNEYVIKLIKHSTIRDASVLNDTESNNLINQLLKTVELIPTNILTLSKPIKCQSRYIGYRAVICLSEEDILNGNQFLNIKSKHLKRYIKDYIDDVILKLLHERERILSVKLHLCEPNEEEKRIRESLNIQNNTNRLRNKDILEKTVNTYYDDDSFQSKQVKGKTKLFTIRRKTATTEDKNRLLNESKKRIKDSKKLWEEREKQTFSCSFTILHTESIKSTVIDKPREKKYVKHVYSEPRVVSIDQVLEWLKCIEEQHP